MSCPMLPATGAGSSALLVAIAAAVLAVGLGLGLAGRHRAGSTIVALAAIAGLGLVAAPSADAATDCPPTTSIAGPSSSAPQTTAPQTTAVPTTAVPSTTEGATTTTAPETTTTTAPVVLATLSGTYTVDGYTFTEWNDGEPCPDPHAVAVDGGLAGVTVTLSGTDTDGNTVEQTTSTDAAGTYSFAGIPAGDYTVSAASPALPTGTRGCEGEFGPVQSTINDWSVSPSHSVVVSGSDPAVTGLDFQAINSMQGGGGA